jgi:hypothetical protein
MEEMGIEYSDAGGKPEENKPHGRSRRRSQNNIKIDVVERERDSVLTGLIWFR